MNDTLQLADESVLDDVFQLILRRIQWMDTVGIRQWNVTNYTDAYPQRYYSQKIREGQLYVLTEKGKVIGAVVLLESDARWKDAVPAYYVHNLVTDVTAKGAGGILLGYVEAMAARDGKTCVRLDCAVDNEKLNQYYEKKGYRKVGVCSDGLYRGNKREKVIQ